MIEIPKSYNYISAFLTFACNYKCDYCINKYNGLYRYKNMSGEEWVEAFNRIPTREDLPITLSGGEPTLHPDFYKIINSVFPGIKLDLLTNGSFDIDEFATLITQNKFKRQAPYASIRFSYHPGYTNFIELLGKVKVLKNLGYSVGIWAVNRSKITSKILQSVAKFVGIDFRLKDYLDKGHGDYKYPSGLDGKRKKCMCKPSELLIAPDGRLFRCHHDLYHGINSYAHVLDKNIKLPEGYTPCDNYGLCNPCDLKLKYDRFQKKGHCSVEIKRG